MVSFDIVWKSSAKKELKKIAKNEIPKIIVEIENLSSNLHPSNSKKLLGTEHTFRLRVGNYRVVYAVENNQLIIEIIRVRHRKEVYKNL